MNTLNEQCELIRAEAEGKQIEWFFAGSWRNKVLEKGDWCFASYTYRIKPEPVKPTVYESAIELEGELHTFKDSFGISRNIAQAPALGYAFVHVLKDKEELNGHAICWRDKNNTGLTFGVYRGCEKDYDIPAMAEKVRKVL